MCVWFFLYFFFPFFVALHISGVSLGRRRNCGCRMCELEPRTKYAYEKSLYFIRSREKRKEKQSKTILIYVIYDMDQRSKFECAVIYVYRSDILKRLSMHWRCGTGSNSLFTCSQLPHTVLCGSCIWAAWRWLVRPIDESTNSIDRHSKELQPKWFITNWPNAQLRSSTTFITFWIHGICSNY